MRATLPPNVEAPKGQDVRPGSDAEGGVSDDDGRGGGRDASGEGGGGGGGGGEGGAVKSFATGNIIIDGAGPDGAGGDEEPGAVSSDRSGSGDYCLVRVDSLDRVCDVIYCGFGDVEAKNLSKIVGVQLGYLQVILRHPK